MGGADPGLNIAGIDRLGLEARVVVVGVERDVHFRGTSAQLPDPCRDFVQRLGSVVAALCGACKALEHPRPAVALVGNEGM